MDKKKKIILIIILSVFCLILVSTGIVAFQFTAPQRHASQDRIVMNLNTSEQQFVVLLKQQGYIRSVRAFDLILRYKHWQAAIQPGAYMVSKDMNAWQFANQLVFHPYQKWVVIPEGLRDEQVAGIVAQTLNWPAAQTADFLAASREGYLFPDTYLLSATSTGASVALTMEDQFNTETASLFAEAQAANIRNDTMVILASLVQREAGDNEDMPLIAEVIWNRLLAGMPLQIDASIQYAMGTSSDWWGTVTPADLEIDSPYNTYTHTGKPPGPICNPGLPAMDAIIHPATGDYLYYIYDSSGHIHLAETYAEQEANINLYLQNAQ